jgi:LuxR family maltose regulon positive regulatory protein
MLELLSGPLCDAVLQSTGSLALLESLERSNRFVVALDRDGEWYRCHHLVRETLAGELAGSEPDQMAGLLGRASDWCAANGQDVAAIRYGQAAGDVQRVAANMERAVLPVYQSGRTTTVDAWFKWFEAHGELEQYPAVAVIGAMFQAAAGRPTESDRWAACAERGERLGPLPDGSESIESWRALLRAIRSRDGVAAMTADAALAAQTLAADSPWHPLAVVIAGISQVLCGAPEQAEDLFADAAEEARHLAAPDMLPVALAERAMLAIATEEWVRADGYAEHAVWAARRSRLEDSALNGLVYAVAARTALRSGRTASAHDLLAHAERLLPQLTYAIPTPAVQARVEAARAYLELADQSGARTMLGEIGAILRRCPDLGVLGDQVAELRSSLSAADRDVPGVSLLTEAELRVLPLLSTHLTFREIGERLYLSRHTVKSHAMSIYRKLGVGSRGAAVERAREIGLM